MTEHFEYQTAVEAHDIDELGHASNISFIRWMQEAAIGHSTENGWSPSKYKEIDCGWVVRKHEITYLAPAFLGDCIRVQTWVADIKKVTSKRRFRIYREAKLLADASTDWAFVRYSSQCPTRIPDEVRKCFIETEKIP